jgi:hypothetical protein
MLGLDIVIGLKRRLVWKIWKTEFPGVFLQNPKHGKHRLARAVVCHRMGLDAQAVEDYTYVLENIRVSHQRLFNNAMRICARVYSCVCAPVSICICILVFWAMCIFLR